MNRFRVWAPAAQRVELRTGGSIVPMEKTAGGWWQRAAAAGDYMFVVDGSEPLPDPRSPWQPEGVHGPSRVVDHSAFRWRDGHWQPPPLPSAIIYELHVGTFTPEGTFDSALSRLDHLVKLGVTHVELMPVNEFSGNWGWGYDGVDLFAPHHSYGGPEGLKRFVDGCHAAGLAVLLDVVYNHLGPVGNYLARFGPYFTDRYSTPWGPAVNLDGPYSTEVRRFFCDNALLWLRDYHVDGLRIDAVHAIFDFSAIHFLEQLSTEVDELAARLGRRLALIAESDLNDPRIVTPRTAGGYGIDAQWSDDFHHALHTVLTGERNGYYMDFGSLAALAKALRDVYVYDGRESAFRKRVHGRPVKDLPGWRFLGYLQNHDQVGNRALGERSGRLMNEGRLKIAAALVLLGPFVPMLFQGEEFAASTPFLYFTDHSDPNVGRAVSQGRRNEFAEFGWKIEDVPDPQDPSSFARSKLVWSECVAERYAGILEWYRRLIQLRRASPELTEGHMAQVQFDESARWLMMTRGKICVACNLGETIQRLRAPFCGTVLLSSSEDAGFQESSLTLPPDSVAILTCR